MFKIKHGFTLAELMVVMLILSIIMAAMAPVMTTRNKLDQSSPWVWAENGSDAYFGLGNAMIAMIGQPRAGENDTDARLLINAGDDKKHILFKTGDTVQGFLQFANNTLAITNSNTQMGENSVVIGTNSTSSGSEGVAIGYNAHASGDDSTAIGQNSGAGKNSVALGSGALSTETSNTDMNNVALGYQAMHSNTNAQNNTAIGYQALYDITSGSNNIAIGSNALRDFTSGFENVAIGSSAMANGGVSGNVAIGFNALNSVGGGHNVAIGYYALGSLSSFNDPDVSIGIGMNATVDGSYSIAIGSADSTATTNQRISGATAVRDHTIALGSNVYSYDSSVAIGYNTTAGYDESEKTYSGNAIAIGRRANAVSSGVAIGNFADASSQGGTPAGSSIAIGSLAQAWNTSAIAIGPATRATGNSSVALGANALAGGKYAIAIGYGADGYGDGTIAIGQNACANAKNGNKICIGNNSGPTSPADKYASPSDRNERIFIGSKSKFNGGTAVLEVHNIDETSNFTTKRTLGSYRIPNNASGVVINGDLIVKGHLLISAMHGASSTDIKNHSSSPFYPAATEDTATMVWDDRGLNNAQLRHPLWDSSYNSDRRLKYVSKENTSGLDKIRQLKVFNYTFKKDDKKTPHVGVIAQDLQKVFPDAVKKGVDGFLNIRFEDMFYAMINAIKELDAKYQAQEKRINELEARIEKLEARIK